MGSGWSKSIFKLVRDCGNGGRGNSYLRRVKDVSLGGREGKWNEKPDIIFNLLSSDGR